GHWDKLGPWFVDVTDGAITLTSRGGAANFSGIEVWRGEYDVPGPADANAEGLAFFEQRIRPLLVRHCYECHSADAKEVEGELRVDSRLGLRRGGYGGPAVVPGDSEQSLLVKAVRYDNPDLQMPPKAKLAASEIADLETWIKLGAPDPRQPTSSAGPKKKTFDLSAAASFWSFQPLADPPAPQIADQGWAYNDIDRFVLAKLAEHQLKPLADADKGALLRRATFDLTGLPPTPEEVDAFLADQSPEAFSRVVDRLLDSPRYGERWGRHWLDVVRYADTAGDNSDFPIPQMYLYRNWVIDAFNRDLPYDQFIREQLAGDLLPAASDEVRRRQTIATGYIANARRFGSRVDDYPHHLTIEDTIDNLGRAYLGLTINCARCHDHKFDPISTEDYYGLYGFFQSTRYPWPGIELEQKQRDLVPLVSAEEARRAAEAHRAKQQELDAEAQRLEKARDEAIDNEAKDRLKKEADAARSAAARHGKTLPEISWAYAVADAAKIEDARVQYKGDPAKTGALVRRRFPSALGGYSLEEVDRTSGRLNLARWIASTDNPLTARVMVNRLWLHHFGQGIVPTPNDFGKQGKPPTHPELLDWLARRFIESGWSIKAMHRLIMRSHTYQLAAVQDPAAIPGDPANDLLSGFRRRRLDAEAIRDALLFLGRNLDASPGGPHPFPPSADWAFTQHNPFKAVYDTNRRSVYLMTQRIQRHPYLAIFDGPDASASTPLRLTSTTPLQSLYLLNDPFVHQQAERIAARFCEERSDDAGRVERAYQLLLARSPAPEEVSTAGMFLQAAKAKLEQAKAPPEQVASLAWQSYVRAMLLLNEFVYID
ncbi:MAG TPA: PSD1 and planctomycete cytochrome C domain-containing protein, partial [Pirellulales bacterium]|nr:PSD1 and planctomycete cytochrome C domain-containing protein [Pirellulales bacterium]